MRKKSERELRKLEKQFLTKFQRYVHLIADLQVIDVAKKIRAARKKR